jgi:hypothetical protein
MINRSTHLTAHTTDYVHIEYEVVLLCFSHQGILETPFYRCEKKVVAENIVTSITGTSLLTCSTGESWKSKIVATETAGTSVLLGSKGGVVNLF